jgi:hypothetical protein
LETQLEVTQAQLETFVSWHETSLQAGAAPFTAKVAKMGTGVEYWEAYCLSFTVEHQEGSTHVISLKLRLKGIPLAAAPALTSLSVEFQAALSIEVSGGYAYGLYAEFLAGLDCSVATGDPLSAEFRARLDVECSGALTNPSLLAEFEASLDCLLVSLASEAFSAEFSAGLDVSVLDLILLSSEFTAALDMSVASPGSLGYQNPATVSVVAEGIPFKGTVTGILRLSPDGTVSIKEYTAPYEQVGLFYSPATAGIAAGKWVKAVLVTGNDAYLSPLAGVSRQFNATDAISWTMSASWLDPNEPHEAGLTILIANDPDFLDVISTFTANIGAIHGAFA